MERLITFITLIVTPLLMIGQDYELPKMKDYQMYSYYWNDTINENQIAYWDNGVKRVDYLNLENGTKLKREYYYEGRLKIEVIVIQYFKIDTVCFIDVDTEEEITEINIGYTDIPNGSYKEYHKPNYSNHDIVKTFGQYKNGKMVGLWSSKHGGLNYTVTANFNSKGQLEGEFCQYYSNYKNPLKEIKIKGKYARIKTKRYLKDYTLNKYVVEEIVLCRRIGKWEFFDKDGRILETTIYANIKNN